MITRPPSRNWGKGCKDGGGYRPSALGQAAAGSIHVADNYVRLEVTLPWLLAKLAEKIQPLIRKQGALMLEKK